MKDAPFVITIIQDVANITKVMTSYFKDERKAVQWMNEETSYLNGKSPTDMIFEGKTEKVRQFILGKYTSE